MTDFRYGDTVVFRGQGATFRAYWPDRILSLVHFHGGKACSVRTIELRRPQLTDYDRGGLPMGKCSSVQSHAEEQTTSSHLSPVYCPGCGDRISGEFDLCRACDREREEENAADRREGR